MNEAQQSKDRKPAIKPANGHEQRPSHEQIARRAYELFLARGGAHGRHEEDWHTAEQELSAGNR